MTYVHPARHLQRKDNSFLVSGRLWEYPASSTIDVSLVVQVQYMERIKQPPPKDVANKELVQIQDLELRSAVFDKVKHTVPA